MDSKSSPQEALNLLKAATDQGFRYVTQGNGSNVAVPLADAVAKHNERNPGKEIIYLNYAAVDPVLTNEKCTFSHFRLDADTSMKMAALTAFMKDQPKISKIYLINQNYSHGQQVSKFFKEGLTRNRPDAKIVGDDLHPLGQVKDFAPYVAKIKQSGADTIVTGNWGQDMTLLIKALNDSGLKVPIYAYYAGVSGHAHGAGRRAASSRSTRSPTTTRTTAARWASWWRSTRRSSTTTCTPSRSTTRSSCSARPWPRPSRPTR